MKSLRKKTCQEHSDIVEAVKPSIKSEGLIFSPPRQARGRKNKPSETWEGRRKNKEPRSLDPNTSNSKDLNQSRTNKVKTESKIEWMCKNIGIIIIIAVFALWRAYFMTRNHNVIWDEAVYLGIGKFLWSAGGAGLWEVIRPLGLPLILGIPWKIGLDQIFWGEIIAVGFSMGCIIMTYLIAKKMHSITAGLISAIIFSTAPTFFLYSGYIMTDIPSTFFMLCAVYLFMRNRFAWSGFVSGVAFMFRYPHGLLLLGLGGTLFLCYIIDRKSEEGFKRIYRFLGGFIILPLIYGIINWFLYHKETSWAGDAIFRPWILAAWHAGNPSEGVGSSLFYLVEILKEDFMFYLAILGIAWLLWRGIAGLSSDGRISWKRIFEEPERIGPWILLLMYLIYFSSIFNKQIRFSIPILPMLSILCGVGLAETADWIGFNESRKKILRAAVILGLVLCIWMFIYPEDQKYFGWRFEKEQPIVEEVYKYFDRANAEGVVLTADPLAAAYTSKLFEPIYFSVDSSAKIYDITAGKSWGVLYVPEAFYCGAGDSVCKSGLFGLEEKIKRDNELVFEKKYGRNETGFRTYQVWKRK